MLEIGMHCSFITIRHDLVDWYVNLATLSQSNPEAPCIVFEEYGHYESKETAKISAKKLAEANKLLLIIDSMKVMSVVYRNDLFFPVELTPSGPSGKVTEKGSPSQNINDAVDNAKKLTDNENVFFALNYGLTQRFSGENRFKLF
jgi:hypothetical protein